MLFGLAVFAILVTPGPTNTLLVTAGATMGVWRSISLLLAEVVGYNSSILIIGGLFSTFMETTRRAHTLLTILLSLYLCWTAAKLWGRGIRETGNTVSWGDVLFTTMLNPKVLVFAFVIIPLDAPNAERYLAGFSAIVVPVGLAWIGLGASARRIVPQSYFELVPKSAAVLLLGIAATLIASVWSR